MHGPDFASLLLNAEACIQYQHIYASTVYDGNRTNPDWYSKTAEIDDGPPLFIYRVYDSIVAEMMTFNNTHVFINTALSQIPDGRKHHQCRIVDFESFFADVGLKGATIRLRMSCDLRLAFASPGAAQASRAVLDRVRCGDALLFTVKDRGETLFCQVGYLDSPEGLKNVTIDGRPGGHSVGFALVSIQNAIHQPVGYFIATLSARMGETPMPLTDGFDRLSAA